MTPFRVLFVCMGNICRSPAAECSLKSLVASEGLAGLWDIDSAGTIDLHRGNAPDPRMRAAGKARGIPISGSARQIVPADLDEFDLILAMDRDNLDYIRSLDRAGTRLHKVRTFRSFCASFGDGEVPDPYYGGPEGFDLVLDILADGCRGLLDHVRNLPSRNLD